MQPCSCTDALILALLQPGARCKELMVSHDSRLSADRIGTSILHADYLKREIHRREKASPGRFKYYIFYIAAIVCVGDVYRTIARLDYSGITEFSLLLVFQDGHIGPLNSIF